MFKILTGKKGLGFRSFGLTEDFGSAGLGLSFFTGLGGCNGTSVGLVRLRDQTNNFTSMYV